MSEQCDHCETAILQGVEPFAGENGVYCTTTCRYDAEVMEIEPGELPRRFSRK